MVRLGGRFLCCGFSNTTAGAGVAQVVVGVIHACAMKLRRCEGTRFCGGSFRWGGGIVVGPVAGAGEDGEIDVIGQGELEGVQAGGEGLAGGNLLT